MAPHAGTGARRRVSAPLVRVAVVGPESSGKSTLAAALATRHATRWVPEASRAYYDAKGIVYEIADILPIARAQKAAEEDEARQARGLLFLDTDLLTITVWSHVLYGDCPAEAEEMAAAQRVELTLLLASDLAWTFDPQRCHPDPAQREDFFRRLERSLARLGRRFTVVSGEGPARLESAAAAVDEFLGGR
jgi:NadR type nicotinamide-nucleotide adenylyltransferase